MPLLRIAYIEPRRYIVTGVDDNTSAPFNDFFLSRLDGIRQAVRENPKIHMTWINNDIDPISFIENNEHLEYDGVMITAPREEVLQELPM